MSGASSGVTPDLTFAPAFLDAIFRYASPDTFIALRVFPHDRTQPPPWMVDVRMSEACKLLTEIERGIHYAASTTDPCVFSPAMATFLKPGTAKGRDVAEGLAIIVELDQGDTTAALARLEALLGPATMVIRSGGAWIDPATGEVHPKLHCYWRLSEPTRTEAEHVMLRAARQNATRLVGADPTGVAGVHCFRFPGSVNRKRPEHPVLCVTERSNPGAEVHLIDAADALADAVEGAGLNGGAGQKGNGKDNGAYQGKRELQADPALVASAMARIPNPVIDPETDYGRWVDWAYAVAGATGGSGYEVFRTWSATYPTHDDGLAQALWDRVVAAKPISKGAGSIFHDAKRHGWIDPRSRKAKSAKAEKTTASNGPTPDQGASQTAPPIEGGSDGGIGDGGRVPPPGGPGAGDGEDSEGEGEGEGTEGEGEHGEDAPKPLTDAERDALFEHAADLDDEDYELERDAIAEQLSRGHKTKFRVTSLGKIRDRIRKTRAKAEAERAAAALKNQPPPPPQPDTPEVKALIAEFNAKYFIQNENGPVVIYIPKHDPDQNRDYYERMTRSDLEMLYLNRTVLVGYSEKTGEPIYQPAAHVWLHHPKRLQYIGGLVFDPSSRRYADDVLNLWTGFAVTEKPGSWEALKHHVKTAICNNDPTHFSYLMDWMADMVQHPEKQGEVAVVLCGPEGTGKGILARALKYLLGQHGFAISNSIHLTGRFNAHLRNCVFLFSDEALFAGNPAHVPILKAIITEPYLTIEGKYQATVMSTNRLHIMLATNEPWAISASPESRRYFVLNANDSHVKDYPYFKAIQDELDNGGHEAMLHELKHRDISASNLRDVPVTAALVEQRMKSLDTTHAWWLDCLMRGYVFESELGLEDEFALWLDPISTRLLYASYEKFARARHERHPLNRVHFGRWLNEKTGCTPYRPAAGTMVMVGEHLVDATTTNTTQFGTTRHTGRIAETIQRDRPPSYRFGPLIDGIPSGTLTDARKAFTDATKLEIEWPDDDPAAP